MVETAGIEPASASPLPLVLHVYSDIMFNWLLPAGRGRQTAIPVLV